MKNNNNALVTFCSYHARIGYVIVNATDQLLRMKESCGIVEIPSSVLPSKIPPVYKKRAAELHQNVKELCDGSLFIDMKRVEYKTSIPYVIYKRIEVNGLPFESEILPRIKNCYPNENVIILGTRLAAKKFSEHMVFEPISLKDNIIRGDSFRSYYYHF